MNLRPHVVHPHRERLHGGVKLPAHLPRAPRAQYNNVTFPRGVTVSCKSSLPSTR